MNFAVLILILKFITKIQQRKLVITFGFGKNPDEKQNLKNVLFFVVSVISLFTLMNEQNHLFMEPTMPMIEKVVVVMLAVLHMQHVQGIIKIEP